MSTNKPIFMRDGKPVFAEGSEEFVIGTVASAVLQMVIIAVLSCILDYALANRGPGVYYIGTPFSICTPHIVLYVNYTVGFIAAIISAGVAIVQYRKTRRHSAAVKHALGSMMAGIIIFSIPCLITLGMHGRLFLIPTCR